MHMPLGAPELLPPYSYLDLAACVIGSARYFGQGQSGDRRWAVLGLCRSGVSGNHSKSAWMLKDSAGILLVEAGCMGGGASAMRRWACERAENPPCPPCPAHLTLQYGLTRQKLPSGRWADVRGGRCWVLGPSKPLLSRVHKAKTEPRGTGMTQ